MDSRLSTPSAITIRTRKPTSIGSITFATRSKPSSDAYTGRTTFYVSDPDDPVIRTWQRIYPSMFKPMSEMPESCASISAIPKISFASRPTPIAPIT